MLDEKDPHLDRQIAQRVITNHRFENAFHNHLGYNEDNVIEATLDSHVNKQDGKGTTVYEEKLSQNNQ